MLNVSVRFWRNDWHIRIRGVDPATGKREDSTVIIEDEVFAKARVSRTSARAEDVARRFAAAEQQRLNHPGLIDARRKAIAREDEMTLSEIWQLYQRRNPEQIKPASMDRNRKLARSLIRCRCIDNSKCLEHTRPSMIHLGNAEEFRNARHDECRVCGIAEPDHPAQTTWQGRKTLTHAFAAVSPRTVWNECGFLLTLLRFAVERSGETLVRSISIARRPTIVKKRGVHPKVKLTPATYFAIREKFDDITEGDRYRLLFDFACATGLRKEPLTSFRMEWYDAETSTIHVPASAMKGRGDSYKPLDVPISRWAASCLDSIGRTTGYAWPNPETGEPQGGFFAVEKKLSESARLPQKFSLHALRGTFNTWLTEHRCQKHSAEVPFFVREKLLGHALPAQVESYTNFDVSMMEAVSVIDCIYRQHTKGTVVPIRRRRTA